MNNDVAIIDILEELRSNNSRNFKKEVLKKYKDNQTWKSLLYYTYNPYIQYYIKKIPEYILKGNMMKDFSNIRLEITISQIVNDIASRKFTGNAAIDLLREYLSQLNVSEAKVIELMLGRDLKTGVQIKTINEIYGDKFIPQFKVMLCSTYNEKAIKKIQFPAFAQLKSDGKRIIIRVENNNVNYYNRSGKPFDIDNENIDKEFINLANGKNLVFDGEGLVYDNNDKPLPRKIGNGILSRKEIDIKYQDKIRFMLWDVITTEEFDNEYSNISYEQRWQNLINFKVVMYSKYTLLTPTETVLNIEQAKDFAERMMALGYEGAIIKDKLSPYEGKRSKYQIKIKAEKECDLEIIDIKPGKKGTKYENMIGSLDCTSSDRKVLVNVSGMDDNFRKKDPNEIIGKIIEVRFNELIKAKNKDTYSLYLPRMVENNVRDDKFEADDFETIRSK